MEYKKNKKAKRLVSDSLPEDAYVLYPARYLKVGLESDDRVFGVVALSDVNGNYIMLNMPVKVAFNYSSISDEKINDVLYKKMVIKKGTPLFKDKQFIPTLDDTYAMLNDWIISSNNIPFYVGYEDLVKIGFKNYLLEGGGVAQGLFDFSMMVSVIARVKGGKDFYRTKYEYSDDDSKFDWVGLSNKNRSYNNLSSMIGPGTYLEQGINAGLNLETDDDSALSKMLES